MKVLWSISVSSDLPQQYCAVWVKRYWRKRHVLQLEVRGLHKEQSSFITDISVTFMHEVQCFFAQGDMVTNSEIIV